MATTEGLFQQQGGRSLTLARILFPCSCKESSFCTICNFSFVLMKQKDRHLFQQNKRKKMSNNSYNKRASLMCADASTYFINIVPLGQLTKKLRRVLPFWSIQPYDMTMHLVCSHGALNSSIEKCNRYFHLEAKAF